MKMRHAKGVPCPHNKGFSIEVERAIDIECLACKHILRKDPELKKKFDNMDPNIKADLNRKKREEEEEDDYKYNPMATETFIPERDNTGTSKNPICPKCRLRMVKRIRKDGTGKFWGCVKFPKCRFSRSYFKANK